MLKKHIQIQWRKGETQLDERRETNGRKKRNNWRKEQKQREERDEITSKKIYKFYSQSHLDELENSLMSFHLFVDVNTAVLN